MKRGATHGLAADVLRPLVTDAGTKRTLTTEQIAGQAGVKTMVARGCLIPLTNDGLVRRLEGTPEKWEAAHDFVARLLQPILKSWRGTVWQRSRPLLVPVPLVALLLAASGLVAFYDESLLGKLQTMQAEVSRWDLAMRSAAGTVAADPRYPGVSTNFYKWRGEANAMITRAVSATPECGDAVKAIHQAMIDALPKDMRAKPQASPPAANSGAGTVGCEVTRMLAELPREIEEIRAILTAGCKFNWVNDAWFSDFEQNRGINPPAAPSAADQSAVSNECRSQFEPSPSADGIGHGIAVSRLLRTLQKIVDVEAHKKTAVPSKEITIMRGSTRDRTTGH